MRFVHDDPRYCPIPIPSLSQNLVSFAGQAEDTYADDADLAYPVVLEIRNSNATIVGGDLTDWAEGGTGLVAEVTDVYEAATGVLTYREDPNDYANVVVRLNQGRGDAEATVFLNVLFGQATASVSGQYRIAADGSAGMEGCGYTATALLSGAPRSGITYKWYLDGQYLGSGDTYHFQPGPSPGEHGLDVVAVDEWGYESSGGMAILSTWDVTGCGP